MDTRALSQAEVDRAQSFQIAPPPHPLIVDTHLSAYRYLRRRNKLWMPTWVWIAIVGLLCLVVGWSAGWMAQRSMRDPQAVLSAPQTGEGQQATPAPSTPQVFGMPPGYDPAPKTDGVTKLLDKMEQLSRPPAPPGGSGK